MGGKREILADLLFKTHVMGMVGRFVPHNKIIVLNYHRFHPNSPTAATPFDDRIQTVTKDQFYRQMSWLTRHTQILSEQDLIEQVTTNHYPKSNRPSLVITFDDGYYDNYAIAYPILKSLRIPAIFFISTEMVWKRKIFWWDVVAYLIKKCRKPSIVINGRTYGLQQNPAQVIAELQQQMKEYTRDRIDQIIHSISEATETNLPPDDLQDRELMTQDHIREMVENQMAIGSHGHSHQAMACLDPHGQEDDLMVSKRLLEQTTGRPVRSVSYPFGLYQYIPSSIQDVAQKCGYTLGFTSNFGINYHHQIQQMAMNRFSGELDKVSTLSLIAVWPELFASKGEEILSR